jgi:hypothetical protein
VDDVTDRLEQKLRAEYEPRLAEAIEEAEAEVHARYDGMIEAHVAEVVARAEADAWEEKRGELERDRQAQIDDAVAAIRVGFENTIRREVDAQLSARRPAPRQ